MNKLDICGSAQTERAEEDGSDSENKASVDLNDNNTTEAKNEKIR